MAKTKKCPNCDGPKKFRVMIPHIQGPTIQNPVDSQEPEERYGIDSAGEYYTRDSNGRCIPW